MCGVRDATHINVGHKIKRSEVPLNPCSENCGRTGDTIITVLLKPVKSSIGATLPLEVTEIIVRMCDAVVDGRIVHMADTVATILVSDGSQNGVDGAGETAIVRGSISGKTRGGEHRRDS